VAPNVLFFAGHRLSVFEDINGISEDGWQRPFL
jgi:hypothetical protein